MKISHMKKDELFEGFYLIKSADLRQTRAGKTTQPLPSKMIVARLMGSSGMPNLITLRPLPQVRLST